MFGCQRSPPQRWDRVSSDKKDEEGRARSDGEMPQHGRGGGCFHRLQSRYSASAALWAPNSTLLSRVRAFGGVT